MQLPEGRLTGRIASIQIEDGTPVWILAGIWKLEQVEGNVTAPPAANVTAPPAANVTALSFTAKIEMVQPNGTGFHEHEVSDLKVTEIGSNESGNPTINGTATVTMREGPVQDVPITIRIIGNSVFAMTLGPEKIENHFGTEPIYGTVAQRR